MKGCIVVVSGDDESCSTALIRFGSVCVAGYRVAGCAIDDILILCSQSNLGAKNEVILNFNTYLSIFTNYFYPQMV